MFFQLHSEEKDNKSFVWKNYIILYYWLLFVCLWGSSNWFNYPFEMKSLNIGEKIYIYVCVNHTKAPSDRKILQNIRVLAIWIETQKIDNVLNIVLKSIMMVSEQSNTKSLYHHYCHIDFERFCSQPSLNYVEGKKCNWWWVQVCILRAGRENLPL